MASQADVQAFRTSTGDVAAIVEYEVRQFWPTIDTASPEAARAALDAYLPSLVRAYGESAALVAADFFDQQRAEASAAGNYTARMADPAGVEQVQGANRWAVGPLVAGDAVQALANAVQAARRLAIQPARLTVAHNAAADPARPGWARIPTGSETCAFCLMLASRGAQYRSADSAGRMNSYHADCDCIPTPFWGDQPYPHGYDPDALYQRYRSARDAAASGSTKAILSELRQREGIA